MNLKARIQEYTAIPGQMKETAQAVTALVSIALLIAILAFAMSTMALERTTRNGH